MLFKEMEMVSRLLSQKLTCWHHYLGCVEANYKEYICMYNYALKCKELKRKSALKCKELKRKSSVH